jgi:hypothetical protein|tara:strand:- start:695 stop:1237 length:543 start_codon:yes stop_codon:yes gene_type:complete
MSEKKNFWTQVISAMNGALTFGGISPFKDVRSSVEIQGLDGRHFIDLTEDGVREGWTTINSPGATQINSGEDLEKGQQAIFLNAENGDITIASQKGKIRIEGTDVEIVATGNTPEGVFWVRANESAKIDSKNITIDAKQSLKLLTTGALTLDGKLGMQILSPICHAVTCATDPEKKPGEI